MKIAALMSFYADPPDTIERAIRSVSGLATHLVAVDGAYGSFPSGEAHSPADNIEAIQQTAADCELELLMFHPSDVWPGGEVEKRDYMYRLADATRADWYTILDTDFVFDFPYRNGVDDVFADLRVAAKRGYEVGKVTLVDFVGSGEDKERRRVESDLPLFYLAAGLPPLRIGPTHYHTWREGYEKHLWGCQNTPQHPHFDMTDTVHVHHEWWHRSDNRQIRKWTYYHQREQAGLEPNPFAAAVAEEV